ncbi:MAG: DUF2961 domain-containing protein [Planctomycetes bacterium]|nr:DUF2961 domain-containing protein [Planctomycetota bacterium]
MDDISLIPTGPSTRWACAENVDATPGAGGASRGGRKGTPCLRGFAPGASAVLAHAEGVSGRIRRIWITIFNRSPALLRGLRLRCFWDGAATAAVDVPLADFFAQGLGRMSAFESEWFSSPEGRSFVSTLPMPFRTGMRIELANESDLTEEMVFYQVDYTVGDRIPDHAGYLHAHWRREASGVLAEDYVILPAVAGRGRFLGACFSVIPNTADYGRTWWGEGEVKAFVDGDGALPTLCGTGTEDYIGTAWAQGRFAHRWQGCPIADEERYRYAFYRLHGPDPVLFQQRLRVTIQRIGWLRAEQLLHIRERRPPFRLIGCAEDFDLDRPATWRCGVFERAGDDWASCAWFYLDRPENGLPPLAPAGERIAGL